MRGASRRTRQVARFRHQRPTVDGAPEEPTAEPSGDEDEGPEKIEVHVHLHRDNKTSKPKRPPPRSPLTGSLFDWHGYYDRICKRPQQQTPRRAWSLQSTCPECAATVGVFARRCGRCGVPRTPNSLTKVAAALGLGAVALVFGLCAHLLGGSVSEHVSPKPVGDWTDADVVIVEVPTGPSPFSYTSPEATEPAATGDHSVATR